MIKNECPDAAMLSKYLQGRLSVAELDALAPHIEGCRDCLAALAALEREPAPNGGTHREIALGLETVTTLSAAPQESGKSKEPESVEAFWQELAQCRLFATEELAALRRQMERHFGADITPSAIARWLTNNGRLTKYQSSLLFQGQGAQLVIGEYELLEPLGAGGMGQVFKARQRRLNREVALKMILSGHFASAEEVQRFKGEAEAAAQLNHPGIVAVYEVNECEGRHFFSMAYVEGSTLQDRLRAGPLPAKEAAELARQVAQAVHYAHERGVVHRDLKPGNVLLTPAGQPMVMDFGLAKRIDSGSDLTHTGQVLGTPSYMAPEQAAGKVREIGPASDLYSLGAVLYCLLTGRPPFQSETTMETLKQVLEHVPATPRLLNPSVPRDLETICLKCLEKSPGNRLASAQELAEELGRFLGGDPIRSRPLGPAQRAWRWCRRRPHVVGLTALTLLLVMAGSAAVYFVRESQAKARAEGEAKLAAKESKQAEEEAKQAEQKAKLVAALKDEFETQLQDLSLTQEKLAALTKALERLHAVQPKQAEAGKLRLDNRLAEKIREQLRAAALSQDDKQRFAPYLSFIRESSPVLETELQLEIDKRLSDWRVVGLWQSPLAALPAQFPTDAISLEQGVMRCSPTLKVGRVAPACWLDFASEGQVEIEATFDSGWEQCRAVGVAIDADGERGYDLVLRIDPTFKQAQGTEPTLASERVAGRSVVVDLLRRGGLLHRQSIAAGQFPAGRLTLRLRRLGESLAWQWNQQPVQTFVDPFSEPAGKQGRFGILASAPVALTSLQLKQRTSPQTLTPLEQGTSLYQAGEIGGAEKIFQAQADTAQDSNSRQQARFKLALCKAALNQPGAAEQLLHSVWNDAEGAQWRILAGFHLWRLKIERKDTAGAKAVFDGIKQISTVTQIASLVPASDREKVLTALTPQNIAVGTVRGFRDADIIQLSEAVEDFRLLGADHASLAKVQYQLMRAYIYTGRHKEAFVVAQDLMDRAPDGNVHRNYIRLLRWNKQSDRAVKLLDDLVAKFEGNVRDQAFYLTTRSRAHYDLKNRFAAESDVRRVIRQSQGNPGGEVVSAYLQLGSLLEEDGRLLAARQVWKLGFQVGRDKLDAVQSDDTRLPQTIMMGVLSGEATDEELIQIVSKMVVTEQRQKFEFAVKYFSPFRAALMRTLRAMFTRTRLRQAAKEAFIWETTSLKHRTEAMVAMVVSEYLGQEAFFGAPTPDQEELLWNLAGGAFEALVVNRTFRLEDFPAAAAVWNGETGGLDALEARFPPPARDALRYVAAHRLLALGRPDDSRRGLEVLQARPLAPELKVLVERDLDRLRRNVSVLRVENQYEATVSLTLKLADGESRQREVPAGKAMEMELPPGEVSIEMAAMPNVSLSTKSLKLAPSQVDRVELLWDFRPDSDVVQLPGLLLQPARLPDGRRWQVDTRLPRATITTLDWTHDQQGILVGTYSGQLRRFDPASGELQHAYAGHGASVITLAVDPQTGAIATGSFDGWLKFWTPQGGVLTSNSWHGRAVITMDWNRNRRLAAGHYNTQCLVADELGLIVREWDAAATPRAISWGPEPNSVTLALPDGRIMRQPEFGAATLITKMETGVSRLAWSPDGTRLAMADERGEVRQFDPAGKPLARFSPQDNSIRRLAWKHHSPHLVVGTYSHVEVWDSAGKQLESWPLNHCNTVAVGRLDDRILAGQADSIVVERTSAGEWRKVVQIEPLWIHDIALLADGKICIVGDGPKIRVFAPNFGSETGIEFRETIFDVAVHPDGKRFSVTGAKTAAICDPDQGVLKTMPIESGTGFRVAWSPAGNELAVGCRNGKVFLYGQDGQARPAFAPRSAEITNLAWHPRGELLAISYANGEQQIWNLTAQSSVWVKKFGFSATAAAWSPDGSMLALSGEYGSTVFVDRTGALLASSPGLGSHPCGIVWLDDTRLAIACQHGGIQWIDKTGKILRTMPPRSGGLQSLSYNAAQRRVSYLGKQWASVWDSERTEPICSATFLNKDVVAVFSSGGKPLWLPPAAEKQLLYLVEDADGGLRHYTRAEFDELK